MELQTPIIKTVESVITKFNLKQINIGLNEEGLTAIVYTTIDENGKESQRKATRIPTSDFISSFISSFQGVPVGEDTGIILGGLEQFIFNFITIKWNKIL